MCLQSLQLVEAKRLGQLVIQQIEHYLEFFLTEDYWAQGYLWLS